MNITPLTTHDGLTLQLREWPVPDARGAVVIVHGSASMSAVMRMWRRGSMPRAGPWWATISAAMARARARAAR